MDNFNVNEFVQSFSNNYENRIIDRLDIPNLLLLDSYDLVSIILLKKCNIFLQFDEQNEKEYLDTIYLRVEQTNSILRSLGNMNYVLIAKNKFSIQIDDNQPQTLPEFSDDFDENVKLLLSKLDTLKNALKIVCEDLPFTQIMTDDQTLFFNKDILPNCTNCGDCLKYCPTQALLYNEEKNTIFFNSGHCIGCNLCEQVCQPKAIAKNETIDLIAFAFDHVVKKVEFTSN